MPEANVDQIIQKHKGEPGAILEVLQDLQNECNYLPEDALKQVSDGLEVPLAKIYGLATFYSIFSLEPRGRHLVNVCEGTACHVRGITKILKRIKNELNIEEGGTTEDMGFSLEVVRCIGCCSLAPAMRIDGDTYGRLTAARVPGILKKYK